MRVLILGGYGLIGAYVTARLVREGIAVVGLARSMTETRRFPKVRWVEGDLARMTEPKDWAPLLEGVDAVVNCAGALQEGPRDQLAAVHVAGPAALYRACEARGVRRIVHVSAAGIDGTATAFAKTKREAEDALKVADPDWVILRPGLVLAPAAYGGTALVRGLAGLPLVTPVAAGDSIVQVVSVHDVAESVLRALAPRAPARVTWDLVHPEKTNLAGLVRAYRAWLGLAPRPVVRVPDWMARLTSRVADGLAFLGWRSPLRTTSIKQLAAGVTGDPAQWMAQSLIAPRSLDDIFAETPSSVQERWFARLYFLKPLGIAAVALFWLFSGIVALGPGFAAAEALLRSGGVSPSYAWWTTLLGGLLDIALGIAVLFRRTSRPALIAMLLACAGYLTAGSILHPELWLDPLGVLAKVVPIMLAMLVLAAIADER